MAIAQTDDKQVYSGHINKAEQLFFEKKYKESKAEFRKALSIRPNEELPKRRIKEINKITNDYTEETALYNQSIAEADQLFGKKKYNESLTQYQKASGFLPDQDYPKKKISEISEIIRKNEADESAFNSAIQSADQLFGSKKYEESKIQYQEALKIKSSDAHSKSRILEIDKLLLAQKQYTELIEKADELYLNKEFDKAKAQYVQASSVSPTESYPKNMMARIDEAINQNNEQTKLLAENYQAKIAEADRLFNAKSYTEAKQEYQNALTLKPSESYPKSRIQQIDQIASDLAEQDLQYSQLMASGESFFNQQKYDNAKSEYSKASNLKPSEELPKQKLLQIDQLINEQKVSELKKSNESYNQLIASADDYFGKKDYASAKTSYQQALTIKPQETYPQSKIAEIDQTLAALKSKDDSYTQAIAAGDQFLKSEDYVSAKTSYQQALTIKPQETYPQTKISEIDLAVAALKSKDDSYAQAIATGDQFLKNEDYASAKTSYQQALTIKPLETYPQKKIAEIDQTLAALKSKDDSYTQAIAAGDQFLKNEDYASAKTSYQQALTIKPQETYPHSKIAEIDLTLAALKSKDNSYSQAIAAGDQFLKSEDYASAKTSYQQALTIKPQETYPQSKISEIDLAVSALKSKDDSYSQAIAAGDQFIKNEDYASAKTSFQQALTIKPQETYPQSKIAEIDQTLAALKSKDNSYSQAIAAGDQFLKSEDYASAKTSYQQALTIKPQETYPQSKISEIDQTLAALKSKDDSYAQAIAAGDQFLKSEDFASAKNSYQQALTIKPQETYPQSKIAEIDQTLAALKSKDDSYVHAIATGDQFLKSEDFASAKTSYQQALTIKPQETYPQSKIAEIDLAVAALKSKDDSYAQSIAAGDQFLKNEDFASAKTSYQQALIIKPQETYPQSKIAEIDQTLAALKSKDDSYSQAIAAGDQFLKNEDYASAKTSYQQALTIKPQETYPQTKIAEIDQTLAALKSKDDSYKQAIAAGDQFLKSEDYASAKTSYQQALTTKPQETYPQSKIAEIDQILAALKSKDDSYSQAIAAGDQFFKSEDYPLAKTSYQQALTIKPLETYPQSKIAEIDLAVAALKSKDDSYAQEIAAGDQFFKSEDYPSAKTSYQQALTIKPQETYPQSKIAEIDLTLASLKSKDDSYAQAIAAGDQFLKSEDYASAKTSYQQALTIKPQETYPQTKIAEIDQTLAALKSKDDSYTQAIAAGDQFLKSEDYALAKTSYQQALTIKPQETYPQSKIAEIDLAVAALKSKDDSYTQAIAAGDQFLKSEDYTSAKTSYQQALTIKPLETYPQSKIAEIDQTLAALKSKDDSYTQAIAAGDQFLKNEDYASAKTSYQQALTIKPQEAYPQTKITEIDQTLAALKSKDDSYTQAIAAGDQFLKNEDYASAKTSYQQALTIKPQETYPQTKIAEIDQFLQQEQQRLMKINQQYDSEITAGDMHLNSKNYDLALIAYRNALNIKPVEQYPSIKIAEITTFIEQENAKIQKEYNLAIKEADELNENEKFDLAIEAYNKAIQIKPSETYPTEMINKIKKYFSDNKIVELNKTSKEITNDKTEKFVFNPVPIEYRQNSYLYINLESIAEGAFKLMIRYGKDDKTNGGFVLDLREGSSNQDVLIKISEQYQWFSEANNWLTISPEGGNITISEIQISKGK